jgi:DNA-binding phage protein
MDVEQLLNAALKTNDLRSICRAVDVSVLHSGSIIEVARAAELDRVTLGPSVLREGLRWTI